MREAKAVSVAEDLSEGCSQESTARLVDVDISVVHRLNKSVGKQGRQFHEERVNDVEVEALQADERHGFSDTKGQPAWEEDGSDICKGVIRGSEKVNAKHDLAAL